MKALVAVISVILAFSCYACSEQDSINSVSDVELEMKLSEDASVKELFLIRDEMTKLVLESGINWREIVDIVENNDSERFADILGYSDEELDALGKRIAYLGSVIRDRYPELRELADSGKYGCTACDIRMLAEKWESGLSSDREKKDILAEGDENQIPLPDPSEKGITCQWISYTIALGICTTLGPVAYWVCAYAAMCGFCSGGWVTTLCI